MTNRQLFYASMAGGVIGQPVYAVYDWFVRNRKIDWKSLFDQGLGQIMHADIVECERPNVSIVETRSEQDGKIRRDVVWTTDIGELREWYLGEWRMEHLIKEDEDYRIMARALSGSRFKPTNVHFDAAEKEVGDNGITLGQLDRTPLQKIQIDYAGLEKFSIDLALENQDLLDLIELMNKLKMQELECALQTKATQIKLWENLSIATMGPEIYRRQLVPMYRRILGRMHGSGKKLQVHYDGQLRLIAEDIASLAFDGIDSLTQAPEGDMTIADARRVWPDKFLWMHPNLEWYSLSMDHLEKNIRRMAGDAGPGRYCLMISEEVPATWETAVPVVLRTLKAL